MDLGLKDRRVAVTGGSKGIGRAIIAVEVERQAAGAAPPYHMAP